MHQIRPKVPCAARGIVQQFWLCRSIKSYKAYAAYHTVFAIYGITIWYASNACFITWYFPVCHSFRTFHVPILTWFLLTILVFPDSLADLSLQSPVRKTATRSFLSRATIQSVWFFICDLIVVFCRYLYIKSAKLCWPSSFSLHWLGIGIQIRWVAVPEAELYVNVSENVITRSGIIWRKCVSQNQRHILSNANLLSRWRKFGIKYWPTTRRVQVYW